VSRVKVSIVKTEDAYKGVRKAIELIRPRLTWKNAKVFVKPNLCSPFPAHETPSNTHPDVVGGLIRFLKEEGAKKVYVGDDPVWGLTSRFAYERNETEEVVRKEGGQMVYFEEEERIPKKVPRGRIYSSISVPKIFDEADIFINAPKMKTSTITLVTLGLKNLFGVINFADRKKSHRGVDLSFGLVDIANVIRPHLNLIDGIVAMEGNGAHDGTPIKVGVLIASQDITAADLVGTEVMGFDPLEPFANQAALKYGPGIRSREEIEIVGEPLDRVKKSFKRPLFRLVHPQPNVEVFPGGICPGCMSRIPRIPPQVKAEKRYAVLIGNRVNYPDEMEFDEVWCFGRCGIEEGRKLARRYPRLKDKIRAVPGCPPLDWWREQTLDKEMKAKGWIK